MKKEIGIIGLGKMGSGLALQFIEKGWRVIGYNRSPEKTDILAQNGVVPAYSLEELKSKLSPARIVWIMVPAGEALDTVLWGENGIVNMLEPADLLIDGGNSNFEITKINAEKITNQDLNFLDAGVSGGPSGARNGACIMVGGKSAVFREHEELFNDISVPNGYAFFEGYGAGHFVKMVHNGIEYGMMQAIAEGTNILAKSDYKINLKDAVEVYNHGSVIESRLVGWLSSAFQEYGVDLNTITSTVAHTGEGAWTVETAKKMNLPTPIIEGSLEFRKQSANNPSYTGKVLSALRNQFGGHEAS